MTFELAPPYGFLLLRCRQVEMCFVSTFFFFPCSLPFRWDGVIGCVDFFGDDYLPNSDT